MYEWTNKWLLKFNDSKCKLMHIGKNNPQYTYYIGSSMSRTTLQTTSLEKDIGVHIDPLLNLTNMYVKYKRKPT